MNHKGAHMPNILILGVYGQIARVATDLFLKQTEARLTLYLRNASEFIESRMRETNSHERGMSEKRCSGGL